MIGQGQQAMGQRSVERPSHLLNRLIAASVQIRTTRVPDQERIARQDHPGLLTATVIGDQVGVVGGGVAWGSHRLNDRVAELHQFAVGERVMVEGNARALRHVGSGPGALDQLRQAGDVVGLNVGLENGGNAQPCDCAVVTYSSTRSAWASTTASSPAVLQPNRYEAQADSSLRNWRKNMQR